MVADGCSGPVRQGPVDAGDGRRTAARPGTGTIAPVIAILAGFSTALFWSGTTITGARSSRLVGASSTLAIVMLTGLLVATPFTLLQPLPTDIGAPRNLLALGVTGVGNVLGLLLIYRAYRVGLVGIVSAIASTEGAIAALASVLSGERVAPTIVVALAVIVLGIVVTASSGAAAEEVAESPAPVATRSATRAIAYASAAALCFGSSLFAAAQVSIALPIVWAVLPARIVGVAVVTLPLVLSGRLTLTRPALPWAVASGLFEVLGITSYAIGARDGVAVTSVLASQFGVVSAVLALIVFRERLNRAQSVGIGTVAIGVAVLSALRAA